MFDTDNKIYQFIVDDLNNIRDKDWVMITLNVERESTGSIGYGGEYINNLSETKQLLNFWDSDRNLSKAFHRLYEIMTKETDKHKWNRLKVTLINGGDLNIKFEWDQELADEYERACTEYDPRWDDTLTPEERDRKYKEMVENGELLDYSKINFNIKS